MLVGRYSDEYILKIYKNLGKEIVNFCINEVKKPKAKKIFSKMGVIVSIVILFVILCIISLLI